MRPSPRSCRARRPVLLLGLALLLLPVSAATQTIQFADELICNKAPIIMMLLIAFVTLINGVCKAGVTFQITI